MCQKKQYEKGCNVATVENSIVRPFWFKMIRDHNFKDSLILMVDEKLDQFYPWKYKKKRYERDNYIFQILYQNSSVFRALKIWLLD